MLISQKYTCTISKVRARVELRHAKGKTQDERRVTGKTDM
jgi:hypothetical protein